MAPTDPFSHHKILDVWILSAHLQLPPVSKQWHRHTLTELQFQERTMTPPVGHGLTLLWLTGRAKGAAELTEGIKSCSRHAPVTSRHCSHMLPTTPANQTKKQLLMSQSHRKDNGKLWLHIMRMDLAIKCF